MKRFIKPAAFFTALALMICAAAGCGGNESGKSETGASSSQTANTAIPSASDVTQPATGATGSDDPAAATAEASAGSPADATDAEAPQLRELMENNINAYGFGGVSYLTKNGGAVYSGGDINSCYRVASVSKQFTAAAALMLYEEGKLDINATIDRYFPEYAHGGEITVSQLMNMSSGIPDYILMADGGLASAESTYGMTVQNSSEENRAIIKNWIFAQELYYTPGTRTDYCNTNYLLLAEIVTQAAGMPYESFITQRMLTPLGMSSTGFGDTWSGGAVVSDGSNDWFDYKGVCYGCADMISNAADLEKWGREFISNKVLSGSIISLMTSDYGGGYGYGITPDDGSGFIYHDGSLTPYNSTLSVSPSRGLILVLLDCNGSSQLIPMRRNIFNDITQLT